MALDLLRQPYLAWLLLRSQPGAGGAQWVSVTLAFLFASRSVSVIRGWTLADFNCTRRKTGKVSVPFPLPFPSLFFACLETLSLELLFVVVSMTV